MAAIYADPEVMHFIGDGSVRTREQTAAGLRLMEHEWIDRGFSMFAVQVRSTAELAGWVGLTVPTFLPEILPAVEIGWRLGRDFWGRGYATEAAREVLRFGFGELRLERIISVCHVDHRASAHVMTKLGMRPYLQTVVPAHGQPVQVMELTRREFAQRGPVS